MGSQPIRAETVLHMEVFLDFFFFFHFSLVPVFVYRDEERIIAMIK